MEKQSIKRKPHKCSIFVVVMVMGGVLLPIFVFCEVFFNPENPYFVERTVKEMEAIPQGSTYDEVEEWIAEHDIRRGGSRSLDPSAALEKPRRALTVVLNEYEFMCATEIYITFHFDENEQLKSTSVSRMSYMP